MNIHRLYAVISPRFRRRRMAWFVKSVGLQPADRLLDVGGYVPIWAGRTNPITLVNLDFPADTPVPPQITILEADGCALPFADGSFDVVFSNSTIEHVGTWTRQVQFAAETRRAGRRLWVQTPARGFPVEPHLLCPFIHWLPRAWQRRLIRNFTPWGWITRPTPAGVDAFLAEVRLLTRAEMRLLFPDCEILAEKFLGLTKSHIAVRR